MLDILERNPPPPITAPRDVLAAWILRLRKELEMSQQTFGSICGIAAMTVARLERGQFEPRLETVRNIWEALRKYAERGPAWMEGAPRRLEANGSLDVVTKKSVTKELSVEDARLLAQALGEIGQP